VGAASQLVLEADRADIAADGNDLSFVTLHVADAQGRTVPRADPRIRFSIRGPGEIVATDNGDATSFEPFPSASRKAFSGQALAIVRARRSEAGTITLRAEADGLAPAELTLLSR
jgi:beta-galactosidase